MKVRNTGGRLGFTPLRREVEAELISKAKNGCQKSAAELLSVHHPLIRLVAREQKRGSVSLDDLIQVGNVALMETIPKFKPEKGARFATYVLYWLRNDMIRYASRVGSGVSRSQGREVRLLRYTYKRKLQELTRTLRRDPSLEEQAEFMEVSVKSIQQYLVERLPDVGVCTDRAASGNEYAPTTGGPNPEEALIAKSRVEFMQGLVPELLAKLTDRERKIIEARFLADETPTFREMSPSLGVSYERVRQLEAIALDKMRAYVERHNRDFGEFQ